MFDMMKMMGKVREVQERMKVAQESLAQITATGEAGAGMVRATVNGRKQVQQIEIDPSILKREDQVLVQDLTVAAINKAMDEVDGLAKEHLRKSTEGLLPNIPGMDLSSMLG